MANCPICNQPLECAEHGTVEPSLGGVAKCAVQHGALWVLVHDGDGQDVQGVTVVVGDARKTTDVAGLASFDPLPDGTYTAGLDPLPGGIALRHDPPAPPTIEGIAVAKGKIVSVELPLRKKPTLVVALAPKLAASVTLDHEIQGTIATRDAVDGLVDFGPVPPGKHTITVTLAQEPAKTHAAPAVAPTVTLAYGDAKEQPVQLVERVKPVITPAKDAVAVGGDRLSLALTADRAWNGKGKLRVTAGAASIKLYRADVEVVLVDGAVEFAGIDQTGVTLAVEAQDASAHQGVTIEWGLESDAQPCAPAVTTKLTAVKATLTIHDKGGTAIVRDVARGDGRVIHLQNGAKERARAKVVVACEPPEYAGKLVLKATKDNLSLHTAAKDGEAVALPCDITLPILPGAKPPAELWVEGKTVSAAKLDSGLELAIDGLAAKADHVVITVVETKLQVCGERPKGGDPAPLADDAKRDPGRALFVQGSQFISPRALVRVLKVPHDAPCTLKLRASSDEIRLFPKEAVDKAGETQPLEHHISTEVAEALPLAIGPTKITDAAEGLVLWAEGAKKTADKATLTLDVDAVDDACDHAAFTVSNAVFEIEVARKDTVALSEVVAVELREKQGGPTVATADVDKLTGKVRLEVPPGAYLVGLGPQSAETAMRILRTGDSLEAPVRVEPKVETKIKYELEPEPTYTKIQFVAYRITTGTYRGKDDKTAFAGDVVKAAKHDIEGRCKIMIEAVKTAFAHADIDTAATTLKIFMAPEFYFRGMLGAYPYETVSMVLDELRKETKDPKYAHWLFVFGSAIGCMELAKRKEHVGSSVTIVSTSTKVTFVCKDTAPAASVAGGWFLRVWTPGTGAAFASQPITTVTPKPETRPNLKKFELDCAAPPAFHASGVWISVASSMGVIGDNVWIDGATRPVTLRATCATATPLVGWGVEQGSLQGIITAVTPKGGNVFELVADVKLGPLMVTGTDIKIIEPGKAEIINVAQVQKGGPGVPMNKDGSRALKELLVYKETISSVDFMGLDYGPGAFYSVDRHMATLDGDALVKLYPTPGSTDMLGQHPNVQGQARVKDDGSPGTGTASEVTTSGLGGGSIFVMHDIAFGLEVCLDHGNSKLKNYYAGGKAKAGEPKVQVQLIPSCGMSIKNPAAVADGLIFNVDAHHHAAKKNNGGADITAKATKPVPPAPMGITITDYFPADGEIVVYEAENTPTKAVV